MIALQTESFDLSDPQQYQRFMNALGMIMNKGFSEGYEHGVADFAQSVKQLRHSAPREGVMAIDRRTLNASAQQAEAVIEHPEMPLEMEFEYLQLGIHAYSQLVRAGIRTVGDLTSKTEAEVYKIMADSTKPQHDLDEVVARLKEYGYALRKDAVFTQTV